MFIRHYFWIVILLLGSTDLYAQDFFSGKVVDASSREFLPFVNSINHRSGQVSSTDTLGFFRISAIPGDTIEFSFVGYQKKSIVVEDLDKPIELRLESEVKLLDQVTVETERSRAIAEFRGVQAGKRAIGKDIIMELPTIAGEPDFIKVVTLLPGASKGFEGSNDFFIRGGAADQNLVTYNGATVYNTGHLFGFLSVFNPSAVGEVSTMTGGFPAEYGGRLSSIIDVRSNEINRNSFELEGGIGLISSRFSSEIPIVKDKLAVQIAGRRTYADRVLALFGEELPYYFYDVNLNVDYLISENAKLTYGAYVGDDVLDFQGEGGENNDPAGSSFVIGNLIQSLTLETNFKDWESRTNLNYTLFDYKINNFFQDNVLNVESGIWDLGLNQRFSKDVESIGNLSFGFSSILRNVNTNLINAEGELAEVIPSSEGESISVLENALFTDWSVTRGRLSLLTGLRVSMASLPNAIYWEPEPRLSLRYDINQNFAVKASYTRMSQYLHRVSSSSFALPTDIWYPVDDQVKPQTANQWTLGFTRLMKNDIVFSMEGYYKSMQNLVEFREGTNLILNPAFTEGLLQGNGESYGFEWLLKKYLGRMKGWLSYTLSWAQRDFDELNEGRTFAARYDRRHNASLVTNYELNKRWSFSAVWEFISGARFTPIIGYYGVPNASVTGVDLIPLYPERNSVKLADTHRLDVSVILRGKVKPGKRWRGDWHFSVYNLYNRATPIAINITFDEETGAYTYEQPGLIGLLPS
ncbi:MAG: carboxypeptidase-like regulatory domain-containing protein, partial [Ekhidna sp.]|nr:carboxypeptidase-like regulatory domain-containing protein [Ekhidna sp.]